jgi:hypothetical protein
VLSEERRRIETSRRAYPHDGQEADGREMSKVVRREDLTGRGPVPQVFTLLLKLEQGSLAEPKASLLL